MGLITKGSLIRDKKAEVASSICNLDGYLVVLCAARLDVIDLIPSQILVVLLFFVLCIYF